MDWFEELDAFVAKADPQDVAKKLSISKESAEAALSFIEEGLDSCETESEEEEEKDEKDDETGSD